ncbi:hypothetical protein H2201_008780 [Coniosporium apollinis]|uniref:Uncharacterized protein n=1 Tax=Coniosporium apollinis TaxID=61459 RepID=A0ABQ9NIJ5_9PEZI|nr:hypothetical protein H2201_008780 [Coniosporium apollinis]
MTRPTKRQRPTTAQHHNVADLERGRRANDMRLKSRFEDIFAKYSSDFSGMGDEIDLRTSKVVVDNGHVAAMPDDYDTVWSQAPRFSKAFADELEAGSTGATGMDDEEQDVRCNGLGDFESMGEDDDDLNSLLAQDGDADDRTTGKQTTSSRHLPHVRHQGQSTQPSGAPLPLINYDALQALTTSSVCRPIVGGASSSPTASRADALLWNYSQTPRFVLTIDVHLKGGEPTVTR